MIFYCLFAIFCAVSCAPPNIRDIKDLGIAGRPDHLKGVPLERDGELNKDFRKEVLLGGNTDVSNHGNDAKSSSDLIRDMFKRADTDKDGRLNATELKAQILQNTQHHLKEGRESSERRFQEVDENGDGVISWDEYKAHYLVEKNVVDKEHAKKHAADHTDNLDSGTRYLLDEEKSAFTKADAEGNGLDEIEWLGFQHPEHSRTMLNQMTMEILSSFDRDKDGVLTVEEFVYLPPYVVENTEMDKQYVEARRREFHTVIDKNSDGKASVDELREYVNPLNENHVDQEVDEIFDLADENKDSFLSLEELLDRAELLVSSGFIHPKNRLHDDL